MLILADVTCKRGPCHIRLNVKRHALSICPLEFVERSCEYLLGYWPERCDNIGDVCFERFKHVVKTEYS